MGLEVQWQSFNTAAYAAMDKRFEGGTSVSDGREFASVLSSINGVLAAVTGSQDACFATSYDRYHSGLQVDLSPTLENIVRQGSNPAVLADLIGVFDVVADRLPGDYTGKPALKQWGESGRHLARTMGSARREAYQRLSGANTTVPFRAVSRRTYRPSTTNYQRAAQPRPKAGQESARTRFPTGRSRPRARQFRSKCGVRFSVHGNQGSGLTKNDVSSVLG